MILNNGEDWQPEPADVEVWERAYPNIQVREELLKMEAWCHSQPHYKRKTKRGIKRFINSWLARARPMPASTSTRHRSLQEDLTDTSWA